MLSYQGLLSIRSRIGTYFCFKLPKEEVWIPVDHLVLTDRPWATMEPLCLGKATDPGRTGGEARLFLEGVFWIAQTGAQRRDLPAEFGK
jgi:hypothetical protein